MTADTVGGVWTYAIELMQALEGDAEFVLATMGRPLTPAQRDELADLPHVEVAESNFALEWMTDPWEDVKESGEWLLDLEQAIHPDVVHCNGYAHAACPFRAPVLVVAHSCVYSWWEAVHQSPPPPEWETYRRAAETGLQGAAHVAAPSRAMLAALLRHYDFDTPASVIPNGRDPRNFHGSAEDAVVFSAGRLWDEGKNVRTLVEAAKAIRWPVCIAGDQAFGGNSVPDHAGVALLGALGRLEMARWMARAPIYSLPALYEPFGLSVVEAALSGCALVLGDIPSLREVWDDGALFVDPRDPAAVAAAVNLLIDDPAARTRLAATARTRALTFSPEKFARRYRSLYGELVTGTTASHTASASRGHAQVARSSNP
jgi:glycogen synthase